MVGKLDLGPGNGSGFYPRLARANAEAPEVPEVPEVPADPEDPTLRAGERSETLVSRYGAPYWLTRNAQGHWFIGFDVDGQPGPDIRKRLGMFLGDDLVDFDYRADIAAAARALRWQP